MIVNFSANWSIVVDFKMQSERKLFDTPEHATDFLKTTGHNPAFRFGYVSRDTVKADWEHILHQQILSTLSYGETEVRLEI